MIASLIGGYYGFRQHMMEFMIGVLHFLIEFICFISVRRNSRDGICASLRPYW